MATTDHKQEVLGSQAGLASAIEVEAGTELGEVEVQARGYWEQVWRRFKRDRVAIVSIFFLVFLVLAVYPGAWLAERLLGHGPNDQFAEGITLGGIPVGPMTRVYDPFTGGEQLLILGASDTLGRDEFLRLLHGGRVSLQVAVLSTIGAVTLGVLLGILAGYYRGWVDTVISQLTEITMAFPFLLFAIALASTVGTRLNDVTFGDTFGEGVVTLVLVFTAFGWFYPARIIRSKVMSLREKEFVEAALMTGASNWRIMRSHLLPHLVAPIIVYSTLIVAGYILGEAALSFLGVGIQPPTPSWGNMLTDAQSLTVLESMPWLWIPPGTMIALAVLSINFIGDGLRDALDPHLVR